jgi:hypothetical protein
LRNIFDQYSQPENRITHAFLTTLNEDRQLLEGFLRDIVGIKAPVAAKHLRVLEQRFPGEEEPSECDIERRGIPDGWIFDDEKGWCVLIESKVMARLRGEQILRHRRTAERRGFRFITAVAITPRVETGLPSSTVMLEWRTIYGWLRTQAHKSVWAARAANYFEVAEGKLVEAKQLLEGALTMFSGFGFGEDHPVTYLEAKRVLGLAMGELRQRRDLQQALGMNPKLPRRPAITGRNEGRVWDLLSLASAREELAFTRNPHLTLTITSEAVEAMVTVPHRVNNKMRKRLIELGERGFRNLTEQVVQNLQPLLAIHPGTTPRFRGVQRRYLSQRSKPFNDAVIEFDLRTAVDGSGPPKMQPRWLTAAFGSFVNNERANYQIQMGALFSYEHCPGLKESGAIDMIADAWKACKPLVDLDD